MSKIINMPVDNVQGKSLGKLQTLVLDVPNGRITSAYINADTFGEPLEYSTMISPTLLSFNAKRNALVLDVSKVEYKEEPQVIFQENANGEVISDRQETGAGPQTGVAETGGSLVQGTSSRDINTTAQIYQSIQGNNLDSAGVEVATLAGHVTLRGDVGTQNIKDSINTIAVTVVKPDNVDNQIVVKSPQASL
jgi:sporulation protein YlmC with PRC-barrel domain